MIEKTGIFSGTGNTEENLEVEYVEDYYITPWDVACKHTTEENTIRAIVAYNESGNNYTAVCLDCLLEWERNREKYCVIK